MNKKLSLLLLPVLLLLVACTDDGDVDPEAENGTEGEAEGGGDFVVSYGSDLTSLDPHAVSDLPSDQVNTNIYETLLTQDEEMEIESLLAEDWEQTDDNTWVFNLREDVTFHDGSVLNAEAVKANFDRLLDPATASARMNLFEMIEEVAVVDEYTVEITTEYPFAPLLNHLTSDGASMISKEVIDEDYGSALESAGSDMTVEDYYELREAGGEEYEAVVDDISGEVGTVVEQQPIGTNYAQFEERNPGESTTLSRFDDYWGGAMNLDTVTYRVVSETGSRIAELETGESHMIGGFEPNHLQRIEDNDETESYTLYNIAVEFIGFNTQKEPLDDKRVRQAISHVVDKEEIIDGIYSGTGRIPAGPIQPELLGHDEDLEGLEHDVERAQELMAEAGYEDGFDISIITNDAPERVDVAIYLQEALQEINVDATVDQLEWGAYLEETGTGDHDIFILGWPNPTGDPDQSVWPLFHSSMEGSQGNRTFTDDERIDELLEAGRMTTDEAERVEIYHELQEILVDEAPMIYMRQALSMNAQRSDVEGLYINNYNKPDFRDVTINE
jgi:peptide/nickel transport system substrate-binding protein